jgi:hypothetical protein
MANNYQQFSVSINDLTSDEYAWLDKLLDAMNEAPELMMDPTGESDEELVAKWDKFVEQVGGNFSELVKAIAYDDSGDKGYWGQIELSKARDGMTGEHLEHYLWLYEEESCNLESPVELIHQFFKRWRPTEYLVLSWAETCSKMRVDEFGGGEVLITGDWVYWPPRHLDRIGELYTKTKQADVSVTDADKIVEEMLRLQKLAKHMPNAVEGTEP